MEKRNRLGKNNQKELKIENKKIPPWPPKTNSLKRQNDKTKENQITKMPK